MRCPKCDSVATKIIDSRTKGERKWRRHECDNRHRFTTWEIREVDLMPKEEEWQRAVVAAVAHCMPDMVDNIMKKLLEVQRIKS